MLLTASLLALFVPLMEGRAVGWPLWTWLLLAAFPLLAAAFLAVERSAERAGRVPLVPLSLLRIPEMRRGLGVAVPYFTGFGGFMFVVALVLQQGLHEDPIAAGWALVPMAVGYFTASLAGPRLVGRFGSRVITVGAVVQGIGLMTLFTTVMTDWTGFSALRMLPGVALAGIGQGLVGMPLFRVVLSGVPLERAGVGSGVLATTQQSSLALGVATLGTLFISLTPTFGMAHALALVLALQAAGSLVIVHLSLRLPRSVG